MSLLAQTQMAQVVEPRELVSEDCNCCHCHSVSDATPNDSTHNHFLSGCSDLCRLRGRSSHGLHSRPRLPTVLVLVLPRLPAGRASVAPALTHTTTGTHRTLPSIDQTDLCHSLHLPTTTRARARYALVAQITVAMAPLCCRD